MREHEAREGGRIALYTDSLFAGSVTAAGGPGAQAGSIYRPTVDAGRSALDARPTTLPVDQQATVTVTLLSEADMPLANQSVALGVEQGAGAHSAGTWVRAGQWVTIGATDNGSHISP